MAVVYHRAVKHALACIIVEDESGRQLLLTSLKTNAKQKAAMESRVIVTDRTWTVCRQT